MKKWMLLFMIGSLFTGSIYAAGRMQNGPDPNHQYYQFMVYRMTEDLQLTDEQAEKLFPIIRPYRDEKRQYHEKMMALCDKAYRQESFTKEDQEFYISEIRRIHMEELKLDEELYARIGAFLGPEQVVKFIFFEHRFRRDLSRELKDRYGDRKEPTKKTMIWRKWKK